MIVTTDILCELTSAIVDREWYKTHSSSPMVEEENGDFRYKEEVQDEFNKMLDIIDTILNTSY